MKKKNFDKLSEQKELQKESHFMSDILGYKHETQVKGNRKKDPKRKESFLKKPPKMKYSGNTQCEQR